MKNDSVTKEKKVDTRTSLYRKLGARDRTIALLSRRLTDLRAENDSLRAERVCEWTPIEEGSPVYTPSCPDGEEWQLDEGCELYPYCHWCGRKIIVVEMSDE